MKNILWFSEVDKGDIDKVGGKGANLGELTKAGIPVPQGFIVTSGAYYEFLKRSKLAKKTGKLLRNVDPEDSKRLNELAKMIQKDILEAKMPSDIARDITNAYKQFSSDGGEIFVAVRSSATAEDLPDASFAGQQKTFLNISGAEKVVKTVQECWASLFEARAIYYRTVNKFDHMKVGIAVPVQKMVQSDASGIMFTIDPVSNDRSKIIIEAGLGLGETVVSGSITPDRYIFDKESEKIVDKEINAQDWKMVREGKANKHVSLSKEERENPKISKEQAIELGRFGKKIEEHYNFPQDTEWAIEGGEIYFVQSRPVTTLKEKEAPEDGQSVEEIKAEVLTKGAAASMGRVSGVVKVIHSPSEIDKVEKGEILVTEKTNPDFVPAMKRAGAIVTDTGGRTSHAAIVSRELGIPCVVGTGTATSVLKTGQMVTVDGTTGLVYKGKVESSTPSQPQMQPKEMGSYTEEVPITGTKVYVNLGEPEQAEKVAAMPVDGVGLLRAEFIIANSGVHPRYLFENGKGEEYTKTLVEGISQIARTFAPRPVVYRCTDFKTNEYRNLKGGDKYEPEENNPMIGYRGAYRYIKEPDLFKLEMEAIRKVREEQDLKNLWVMVPFVRTVGELEKVKGMLEEYGLKRNSDFKLWMMVEIPSNVILLEDFLKVGIDGVSIGSNDLTQLTLGTDRDNETLAEEFDERDLAVVKSIEYVIRTCRKHHVSVSICGQAPSTYPEITEMMVRAGTTSVSVTPDVILQTRKLIASVEKRILLGEVIDS